MSAEQWPPFTPRLPVEGFAKGPAVKLRCTVFNLVISAFTLGARWDYIVMGRRPFALGEESGEPGAPIAEADG